MTTSEAARQAVSACAAEGEPTVSPGVHEDLGWALATVLRAYVRAADHALAGLPGGARGYRMLASAARECPRSQLLLAQQVGLDRTVVTYLLDDLAAGGLVERTADPTDRRTRRIVVTTAGRARLIELERRLQLAESHVLRGLADGDADLLRGLLRQVAERAADDADPLTCTGIEDLAASG